MLDKTMIETAERIEFDGAALKDAPAIKMSRRGLITGLACGTVIPIMSACTTNPETGAMIKSRQWLCQPGRT